MAATASDFKTTITTMFWVGEPADAENAFIPNHESYWDKDWLANFGGVDEPWPRDGHWPIGFTPKENPFYVALPYGEFLDDGMLKTKAYEVPWYQPGLLPLLKNRWVEIRHRARVCFAQWQDVGPLRRGRFRLRVRRIQHSAQHVRRQGRLGRLARGLARPRHAREHADRVALRRCVCGFRRAVDRDRHRLQPQPSGLETI